jgi:hypothetical protein
MSSDPYAADWQEDEQAIDSSDEEMVISRDEGEMDADDDPAPLDGIGDDPETVPMDPGRPPGLDATVDAFVDLFNARDLDGLADLFAADTEAPFLGEASRDGVCEGLGDMLLRYPGLTVTRGELGPQPIAAAWLFDQEQQRYDLMGYFTVEVADADPERIERLDFVEEPDDPDDLMVEVPERTELSEWEDWTIRDEG